MKDIFSKGLALGLGLAMTSREQIEKIVDELVKKGEVTASESKELLQNLVEKGETEKKEMNSRIRDQLEKLLAELNIPTRDDIARLEEQIQELKNKLG